MTTATRPAMSLESFAIFVDLKLVVTGVWHPGDDQQWQAKLQSCDILVGGLLKGAIGFGDHPRKALDELARDIVGCTLKYADVGQRMRMIDVRCNFIPHVGPVDELIVPLEDRQF